MVVKVKFKICYLQVTEISQYVTVHKSMSVSACLKMVNSHNWTNREKVQNL